MFISQVICIFGHRAIVKYRPQFKSAREHDLHIIDMIIKLGKRDILMVLGDFLFDGDHYDEYIELLSKKKCRIKLVMGNHDSMKLYKEDIFEMQLPLFSYKNKWISHAPIHPQEIRGRLGNIHGHLHGDVVTKEVNKRMYVYGGLEQVTYQTPDERYFNVNLDNNNFEFVKVEKITEYFEKLSSS